MLPEPGTEYGPCEKSCDHKDCAWTRKAAESICRFCDKPIGYDRGYYVDSEPPVVKDKKKVVMGQIEESFVHSSCQQEDQEKKFKAAGV
jgi:hypothetical protein